MQFMRLSPLLLILVRSARLGQEGGSGGSGNDVCQPWKGVFWDTDAEQWTDSQLVKRFHAKQEKALDLASWLENKTCLISVKGGRSCLSKWLEMKDRLQRFASCALVPRGNGSSLSEAVWGEGPDSLQGFFQEAVAALTAGLIGNPTVANYLGRGNCSLNLDKVAGSVTTHLQEAMQSTDTGLLLGAKSVADAVLTDVFGENCSPSKVLGLGMLRDELEDQITKTIAGTSTGDLSDTLARVEAEVSQEEVAGALDAEREHGHAAYTSLAQLEELAEGAVDSDTNADIVKILLWVVLCIVTGGLGIIIMVVCLIVIGPEIFR